MGRDGTDDAVPAHPPALSLGTPFVCFRAAFLPRRPAPAPVSRLRPFLNEEKRRDSSPT